MAKKEEIATTNPTEIMQRPAFINPQDKTGTEDIGKKDLRLPRLVIAQGTSKQIIEGESQYIEGLKMFDLFNDLTEEIYGKGPLTFVPLRRDVIRIEFDKDDRTKVIDRNVPENDRRMFWTEDEKGNGIPPAATKFTEFVAFLIHENRKPEPIVISIKETNKFMRAAAEKLTSYVKFQDGPIYAGYKTVTSKSEKNDSGTFGVYVFKNAGFIQSEEFFNYCASFAKSLEGKNIETNRTDDDFDASKMAQESM